MLIVNPWCCFSFKLYRCCHPSLKINEIHTIWGTIHVLLQRIMLRVRDLNKPLTPVCAIWCYLPSQTLLIRKSRSIIYKNLDIHIKRDATRQQSILIFTNFRLLLCIPDVTCTSTNTQMRHIYDDPSVTSTISTSVTQITTFLQITPRPPPDYLPLVLLLSFH